MLSTSAVRVAQVAPDGGELGAGTQQLGAVAGDVAQAQDGLAADRAALGVDEAVRQRAGGQAEGLAAPLELLDRAFHRGRIGGREPAAEGEHALHGRAFAGDRRVALEARPRRRGRSR